MPDHPGQRETAGGRRPAVVVAVIPVGIRGYSSAAYFIEGYLLGRGLGTGSYGNGEANRFWIGYAPLQNLHTAKGTSDDSK